MLNKINIYILKRFLFYFFITFIIIASILFIGDFVEQFRKSTGKNVPLNIILQLTAYNFPSLISFSLPITAFFGSVISYLSLIRNSESIIIETMGKSNMQFLLSPIILYLIIGILFVTTVNPLITIFEERYSQLEYRYINKVDKYASITKNGIWLKQENSENNLSSVLYAKKIKNRGQNLIDFMVLEYDSNGSFNGRLDGEMATLKDGYWEMHNTQVTPKYEEAFYKDKIYYKTNINIEDITDSLSPPTSISIWRLVTFINFLEGLGYSAIDFKMHFYNLVLMPFFILSLVFLSSSLVINLKQNDKFGKIFFYAFLLIFIIYFLSNLFDALGNSSQIHPFASKAILPIIVTCLSLLIYQYSIFKRKKII